MLYPVSYLRIRSRTVVLEEDGFEPSQAMPTGLQPVSFDHSDTPPYLPFSGQLTMGIEPATC